MDRSLDPELLSGALDGTLNLPTAAELRTLIASAEVATFFAGSEPLDPVLLETAWNLHHVGTVRPALQLYGAERQVQANAVAAHIFDLALSGEELSPAERLVFTFAAQVSYIRGDRTPNATAIGRRIPPLSAQLAKSPGLASLELGCTFLTFDRGATAVVLRRRREEVEQVRVRFGDRDLSTTVIASAVGVVEGSRLLQRYLTSGDGGDLEVARTEFLTAANSESAQRDLDSRWVAAHLLDLCDDLGRSSVWAILPTGAPPGVGRAMTLGDPPVMTLWPPQVAMLADPASSPLQAGMKRAVLTFPTSAGKTLLAQLVVANHLATTGTGVCFVAPSHSLCREIREGLDRRLWVLRKYIAEDGPLGDPATARAPVVVMTPERLAARLRSGEEELLEEFGLFVLDEAHLIDDDGRGWTFETTISRLHALTANTDHRLVLISAALGGTASVRTWLGVAEQPVTAASRWRGPRRLHATYVPQERLSTRTVVPPEGQQRLSRTSTELRGVLSLYVDGGEAIAAREAPLGRVVRAGQRKVGGPSRSDQLSPVVHLAAAGGPVLTVHATKISAERLARAIAQDRAVKAEAAPLVRLAELRLGATHPLVSVLEKGVAYHHAALPLDIQAEIEGAVRGGALDVVCATTTLTEGINLPFRTVLICERGYYDGTNFHTMLDAADLMNAAGRAGRAGRETEGWVIVASEPFGINPRTAILGLDDDNVVQSTLATHEALDALAEYELLLHETAGLLLENVPVAVDGFLAFCWYLADSAAVLDPTERAGVVIAGVRGTLAWQQMTDDVRSRWEAISERVAVTYEGTDETRRKRWARSGARLSANVVLEDVARSASLAAARLDPADWSSPDAVLRVLLAEGRQQRLLELVPERDRRFKRKRYGPTEIVEVEVVNLILDWAAGVDLAELVERHLSGVEAGDDDSFRFEQLSTFLARVCEHHLPWTLGTILGWINESTGFDLCPSLPAHLHYGVGDTIALTLMTGGVRSRRLAVQVGNSGANAGVVAEDLRGWLTGLGISGWRSVFAAGTAEIADLLQFLHDPTAAIGGRLLEGASVDVVIVPVTDAETGATGERLDLSYVNLSGSPRPIGLLRPDGSAIGTLQATEHRDIAVLLDAGFRVVAELIEGLPAMARLTTVIE